MYILQYLNKRLHSQPAGYWGYTVMSDWHGAVCVDVAGGMSVCMPATLLARTSTYTYTAGQCDYVSLSRLSCPALPSPLLGCGCTAPKPPLRNPHTSLSPAASTRVQTVLDSLTELGRRLSL